MKQKGILVLGTLYLLFAMGCSCTQVPAGHVGIKVYMLGQKKGVESEPLGVGRYFVGINEAVYTYPLFIKVYPFTKDATEGSPVDEAFYFQTVEGVKCNVDIGVQARADADKVSILFQTYRDDMEDIIKRFIRNDIRDLINKHTAGMKIEDLYGPKKIEMIKRVESDLKEKLAPKGIIIESIAMLSEIRFPPEVEQAIVAKIKATQEAMQRENEVQKAEAEKKIKILNAQAEAEAIRLKQLSITPTMVQYEAVMKWNGVLPTYMMGSGGVPFINIK